jgi:uncharacterized Zn ribbon protein
MFAAEEIKEGTALKIINRIFTSKNSEGLSYQTKFNDDYTNEDATAKLLNWLKDFGLDSKQIKRVQELVNSDQISDKLSNNKAIIENSLKVKGIPTMIYDGTRHTGLWK